LARVLRPSISLLAMVRLAGTCAAAALPGWRRAFTEDDLYANGSWLEGRHALIERRLWQARPAPLKDQLFLYDVTSSYTEGDYNAMAAWGYNRDRKEGKKQSVIGLLTVSQGIALVGDRGMIHTDQKRVAQEKGFHFITAQTKPKIQKMLDDNVFQLELFEEKVREVLGEDGPRFALRRKPVRQEELKRAREQKRQALQSALKKANTYLDEHPRSQGANPRALDEGPSEKFAGCRLAQIVGPKATAGSDPGRSGP
jgi:hypothetical protein